MSIYGTLPGALAYHAARGNTAWAAAGVTDELRTAAMTRAATALDGRYGRRFPGSRTGGRAQTLAWPRESATDAEGETIPDDEVPVEIVNASYELALSELVSPGALSPTVTPGKIKTRARVEGAVDVTYKDSGVSGQRPVLTIVDDILAPLLGAGSATVDILRV
ncbi:DnaT-like ssDNA-binding protein [Parvibaculum sp.]|uniref:DnaT-like ssDNA-binding protein n=1 Tax=Parvibaculum sp. TaxID=2024848 RepID=UPI001E16CC68|nr:DnaT-like ssDNA-binding protein [Parvibaculum sp.]MBX3490902.1 hypothetical protein [Parvibaculum sp.]